MGKEWEQRQIENLVKKQRERIAELEKRVENEHPLPRKNQDPTPKRIPSREPGDIDKPTNH